MTMIRVFKPEFDETEIQALRETMLSGWVGLGPKTAEFEQRFARFIGVGHSVGVNSATAALDIALRLLNIEPGDEVIVPTITFVSTAHVVVYNKGIPVFADCDPDTLGIDLGHVERLITPRTRAIIPVHYGGRPVDMDALRAIAGHIPIIEDAAHACGGAYKGKRCGSLGEIGCFSFHAVKNLAMGDGGALTLNDQALAARAKRLRWLGIDKGTWDRTAVDRSYWWEYQVNEIGLKCHMNDIQAAIGLVQLDKLERMNARRRQIVGMYQDGFRGLPWLTTPPADDVVYSSAWHIYCVKAEKRDDLSAYLQERGIATGVHYKPIHLYKCYRGQVALPRAEAVFKKILTLPLYPGLTDEEVGRVIEAVRAFPPSRRG